MVHPPPKRTKKKKEEKNQPDLDYIIQIPSITLDVRTA